MPDYPVYISSISNTGTGTALSISPPPSLLATDFQLMVIGLGVGAEAITSTPWGWTMLDHLDDIDINGARVGLYLFESGMDTGTTNLTKDGTGGWRIIRACYAFWTGRNVPASLYYSDWNNSHTIAAATTGNNQPNSLAIAGYCMVGPNGENAYDVIAQPSSAQATTGWQENADNPGNLTADGKRVHFVLASRVLPLPSTPVTGYFQTSLNTDTFLFTVILNGTGNVRGGGVSATALTLGASAVGGKRMARTVAADVPMTLGEPTVVCKKIAIGNPIAEPLILNIIPDRPGRIVTEDVSATPLTLGMLVMTDVVNIVNAEPLSLNVTIIAGKWGVGNPVAEPITLPAATLSGTKKIGVGKPSPVLTLGAFLSDVLRIGGYPLPLTRIPIAPPDNPLRVLVQDILTREWADLDLEIEDLEYTRTLSGPTIIKGVFKPETDAVKDLGIDAWKHWVHVEVDGQIRASGVGLPINFGDQSLDAEVIGFTAMAENYAYDGEYSVIQEDPLNIVRMIWNYIQSQPESNFGITVDTDTSPVRVGQPEIVTNPPERTLAADAIRDRFNSGELIYEDWTWPGCPQIVNDHNDYLLDQYYGAGAPSPPEDWLTEYIANNGPLTQQITQAQPYELMWWNVPQLSTVLNSLATETPFDYVERTRWNDTRTDVLQHLELGYPRIGVRKTELEFVQGQNILDVVPVREGATTFASAVLVIGAGEGRDSIRGFAAQRYPGRVYRNVTIVDKTILSQEAANARAHVELHERQCSLAEVHEITIDTAAEGAPLGTFDVGDEILPQVYIPWLGGDFAEWHRIITYTYKPANDLAVLTLARANTFGHH
jgi:hypothetical protein